MAEAKAQSKTVMQRFLDGIERVGNMVPHPVIIFLILIAIVIVLSALLGIVGATVSYETIDRSPTRSSSRPRASGAS